MKDNYKNILAKIFSLVIALILVFPTELFAASLNPAKASKYNVSTSIMELATSSGDVAKDRKVTDENKTTLIKSDQSIDETDDYIIEKYATLSKTTGLIDYKVIVRSKNKSENVDQELTATFAVANSTDLAELKVDKVTELDEDNKETDLKYQEANPGILYSNDSFNTIGIKSSNPQNAVVYYLSAKIREEVLKNIENNSPQMQLEINIGQAGENIYQDRYELDLVKEEDTNTLVEVTETHLIKGIYINEKLTILGQKPAQIIWTDYINPTNDKEFTYDINLDDSQDTSKTEIKIEFYEASEKGFVIKDEFIKTIPFANSLKLQVPNGYMVKVEFKANIKENQNPKEFTFNQTKLPNPKYEEIKEEKETQSEDEDPLPKEKFSEDKKASENTPQTEENLTAISLNKDSLLAEFKNEGKLNPEIEADVEKISQTLERYNSEEITWEEFLNQIQTTNLSKEDFQRSIQTLTSGLDEENYKIANLDASLLADQIYPDEKSAETKEKSVDDLVKEKLSDPSTSLEDFQNYMYELEEEYGLTNEDADRIYGDNAQAIQALIENHRDNNLDPMVLAEIINANRHTIDRDWTEDEGLREALNKYQLAIYGYGNPVIEEDNITSIDWKVTYYSDKPLSTQGLLASITAVEGSGIDTDGITDIKVNGSPITLANNPADGKHGINDSYYSDLSNYGDLQEYSIEFSTPVTEKQDYYTLDFFGQYNKVNDESLKDRKPRGSARLTSPGYIDAQKTKDNPDASYADNKETVRGYYNDLVDGKPTKARWIVTDHVTTQYERSLPFDTKELSNQDLESLKVSFYTPDENGKLVQLGETEDLTNDYPLSQGSLFAHPPIGTIAVYEYVTKLQGDPYKTEYALGDTKLGELTEEYTIKKEWQGITNETEIPAIDVTLTGSDNITNITTRLSGVLDRDRRETTKVILPKWTLNKNAEQGLDYSKIEYKVSEEKIVNGVDYTNLASNVIEHLKEIELVNKVVKEPTPGSLTVELLETDSDSPLDNVEFIISGPEIEKTARTGSDGKILFDKLPEGTYTLVQNDVKTGYRKPEDMGHIQVDPEGNIRWTENELIAKGTSESQNPTLTVYNDKLDNVEFKIKKIGEDNIALTGARFELRDKNGNLVSSGLSGEDGYINFGNVTSGQYTLNETQAPDGYDLSDKVYDVTIDESNYIEIRENGRVIAKGYPESLNDGPGPSTETKVNVNRNELILDETGQAGGRANVLDRYRFETINYVLEMNVQNPKDNDQFSIQFDDNLEIERNIAREFPNILDKDNNIVANFENFNIDTNELIYKFNPEYIEPGMDINIKYEVEGIRPDDYKVLNKYGEGKIAGHPGAKNWTFSTDLNYNGSSKDSRDFSVEIDMASGSDSLVYSSLNSIGSSVLDINRNEETRKPETFKEVFYINPVPGQDIGSISRILLKFMTKSINSDVNMGYTEIISNPLPDKGFSYTDYRVYRVPDSQKYDLMPTSYGVDENALKDYEYTSYKSSGARQDSFETILLNNMDTTSSTDAFVIVVDFKVTNPDIIDKSYIANQVQKIGGQNESRAFFMGVGSSNANSNAVVTTSQVPDPFELEIPNEKYLPGSFELKKIDSENNNLLPGAVFTLYNENQSRVIDQKRTGDDGKITVDNLRPGTYKLVETKSPDGYKQKDQVATIVVSSDGKVSWTGNGLLLEDDTNVVETDNGQINPSLTVTNEPADEHGKITIEKKDDDGNPLDGVKFTLYSKNMKEISSKTSTGGTIIWDNLPYGKYWVKETKAKDGYEIDPKPRLFSVTKDYPISEKTGKDISNNLEILAGESNIFTESKQTRLMQNQGDALIANIKVNKQNDTQINPGDRFELNLSEALILEDRIISGVNNAKYDIVGEGGTIAKAEVSQDKKMITYTFTDYVKNHEIDSLDLTIPVYFDRTEIITNMHGITGSLSIGTSEFKEKISGVDYSDSNVTYKNLSSFIYQINQDNGTFKAISYVNLDRESLKNKKYSFKTNTPVDITSFKVYKKTSDKLLPKSFGIDFRRFDDYGLQAIHSNSYNKENDIYDVKLKGDTIGERSTLVVEIDGKIKSREVPYLEIQSRFNGVDTNGLEKQYFDSSFASLDKDQANKVFINRKNYIEFTKVAKTTDPEKANQVLAGATFVLKKYGENIKEEKTSDANGKFGWDELGSGKYEVWEKEAPGGYIVPKKPVARFEVDTNGKITNVSNYIIENTKATYPSTAGDGTKIAFALIGTAIMLTGLLYFGIFQNEKNRKRFSR